MRKPDNDLNDINGMKWLFHYDCLNPIKGGKELSSEYDSDEGDGYEYILLPDGSISKKINESKFQIPLVDSLQFKINPTIKRFVQFIIDDYQTEKLIKIMSCSDVINRVKTSAYTVIYNQEIAIEIEKNCDCFTYVIKNLDVLILLQQSERLGMMPCVLDNNNRDIIKQYGLWTRRDFIEILKVE
jgi:hypothetical protein